MAVAVPLIGALISYLPVPSVSSGYGRVSQGYDYDDTFYDKEYRGVGSLINDSLSSLVGI